MYFLTLLWFSREDFLQEVCVVGHGGVQPLTVVLYGGGQAHLPQGFV